MEGNKMARRDFLKLSLLAAGAVVLSGCHVAGNYSSRVEELRDPLPKDAQWKEILRYATLAPNGHNTQPWKFALKGKSLEIHPDETRHLRIVDPQDREQWISLGCALENLLLAAHAAGWMGAVTYPTEGQEYILVEFETTQPKSGALFEAIPVRQSTRSAYKGEALTKEALQQISATEVEPGVQVQFISGAADMENTIEYVNEGNKSQYANDDFLDELIRWLRFNEREALDAQDGLFSRCTGNPAVPRWLGSMIVGGTKPQGQADADAKKMRSSAGMVLIASESDDKADWVRSGQVFERLSLNMTAVDVKSALQNQPIEVPELRGQFQQAMGLGSAMPQLLMRFGIADALPYSLRRPVEDVLI